MDNIDDESERGAGFVVRNERAKRLWREEKGDRWRNEIGCENFVVEAIAIAIIDGFCSRETRVESRFYSVALSFAIAIDTVYLILLFVLSFANSPRGATMSS